MTPTYNSKKRLIAACNLMNEGNSMEYAAGVYSLPIKTFEDYLCGLSVESSTDIPEINMPLYESVGDKLYVELNSRVHDNCDYAIGKEDAKTNDRGAPDWSKHSFHKPLRECPYPTKGHLSTGGVQSHSAGDIFPYTVVLVGDAVDHDYHLIGGGLNIGDCKWGHYNAAHNYATQLLNPLLME